MFLKKLAVPILTLALLGALTGCSQPEQQMSAPEVVVTASELPPGWMNLTEEAPRVKQVTTLTQKSETTWDIETLNANNELRTTLVATPEDEASNGIGGLSAMESLTPLGLVFSMATADHNPGRLRDNLSNNLFSEQVKMARDSGSGELAFTLTPEMVTAALQVEANAGLRGSPIDSMPPLLEKLFEGKWPECKITLGSNGEMQLLTITNGSYFAELEWGT